MEDQLSIVKGLLIDVHRTVKHQKEIKKLKGENFNIFSVLGMESRENATHSAFLGELLNPKGSHLFGTTFLELFIEEVNFPNLNEKLFDIQTAKVVLEKFVGTRNDDLKTGGRIDIYLIDANGNSISIENKIYAGDQYAQIERYVSHNSKKNTVFYLTLFGEEASEDSTGDLSKEEGYYCISYAETIVGWLEKCLKEAAEQPILRESIKQYILLIKKLTNQLTDKKMEKDIKSLIAKNYKSARTIASIVGKVELDSTHQFLIEVKKVIELELSVNWSVDVDDDLNTSWSGLRLKHDTWNGAVVKLEGQSKVPWNSSIYGIHSFDGEWDRKNLNENCASIDMLKDGFKNSRYWPFYKTILSFSCVSQRERLFDDTERKLLVSDISKKLIEIALACEKGLANNIRLKK